MLLNFIGSLGTLMNFFPPQSLGTLMNFFPPQTSMVLGKLRSECHLCEYLFWKAIQLCIDVILDVMYLRTVLHAVSGMY